MNQIVCAAVLVLVGIASFVISLEVRANTEYRSTARKALLGIIVSTLMVVGGIYWALQIQVG